MTPDTPKKPDQGHPEDGIRADEGPAMKSSSIGPRLLPTDLRDPNAAHDALLHWDVQDEQILRLLADHPEHRGRLEGLQRADAWLRQRAQQAIQRRPEGGTPGSGPDLLVCPSADELYDFGGGPGANALPAPRRQAIDAHLAVCLPCDQLILTLAASPPSPLLAGAPSAAETELEPVEPRRTPAPIRRMPRRGLLTLVAAAAGLVLAVGVWRSWSTTTHAAWPEAPLLRGATGEALLYPRGKVLARTPDLADAVPALAEGLTFEVEPQAGATGYRFELARHGGGAFDPIGSGEAWESSSPTSLRAGVPAAGHYTWKALASTRGLEIELGSRDFEAVADAELLRELSGILRGSEPDAAIRAVRFLHERGFVADARALARGLPATPGRDAYLGRAPGR